MVVSSLNNENSILEEAEMKKKRIAVVTGANRGIGKEICRQLARLENFHVILTARSKDKGEAAVDELRAEGLDIDFHTLDVNDEKSIQRLMEDVERDYGRLDVLVNNAGILIDRSLQAHKVAVDMVKQTLDTNLLGPISLCQAAIPLMQKNNYGRIVNISSGMGQLAEMGSSALGYRLSKVGLNALTRILSNECKSYSILINCMCPGWVHTDMGGPNAPRTLEEGADTAIWLATLPEEGPSGEFFRNRAPIPW